MKCLHCEKEDIEKDKFLMILSMPNCKVDFYFCGPVCQIAAMIDDIIDNPRALSHMDKEPWIPVLRQFHDEMLKMRTK